MREYDLATVCKWIGNSPAVAAKHYATSVDLNADFHRATGLDQAQQKAQQSAATSEGQPMTSDKAANKKPPVNQGHVESEQSLPIADKNNQWAVQGSNL